MKMCENGKILVYNDDRIFRPVKRKEKAWRGEIGTVLKSFYGVKIAGKFHRIYVKPYFRKYFVVLAGKEIELELN